jgi:hypothetical protein
MDWRESLTHVVYVPWPINHVAKILNLKKIQKKFQFLKKYEYFSHVSYLPHS